MFDIYPLLSILFESFSILKQKSLNDLKADASEQDVYDVAAALFSLGQHPPAEKHPPERPPPKSPESVSLLPGNFPGMYNIPDDCRFVIHNTPVMG
ncbi:MAG: hypothetical protein VR66_24235 [Peptococcaceae bacterium BRH_c23]|nr:MAG: hypothetical protein VR66_24235 [Peptococcaceae bacterium BRH_c23]